MAKRRKQVINEAKLSQWINTRKNVLFVGRHGVGKTSIVKAAWDRAGFKYRMYSCATLDPWVDFIGVPEKKMGDDGQVYLDLIRPKEWEDDTIEAIFLDEFNRSHKKIRNACMELIQFKSINGRVFPNLKIVWAAINPEDEDGTYDVDRIDPAQEDRFHLHIDVAYEPSREYFTSRYGADIATQACDWWGRQTVEVQNKISPRRLEYAIDHYYDNGDLWDVLPHDCGKEDLQKALGQTPILKKWREIYQKKDTIAATEFLADEDRWMQVEPVLTATSKKDQWGFMIPCLNDERISSLISTKETMLNYCIQNLMKKDEHVFNVMKTIADADLNSAVANRIRREIRKMSVPNLAKSMKSGTVNPKKAASYTATKKSDSLKRTLPIVDGSPIEGTYARKVAYEKIMAVMPEELDTDLALKALASIERIMVRTNAKIAKGRFDNVMGVLNRCFEALDKADKVPTDTHTQFPAIIKYIAECDDFYFSVKN